METSHVRRFAILRRIRTSAPRILTRRVTRIKKYSSRVYRAKTDRAIGGGAAGRRMACGIVDGVDEVRESNVVTGRWEVV